MGVANVIPGVSGGTIALITEIYEDLINSLKSFDLKALRLITSFKFTDFIQHTNMYFLIAVFGGSVASVFSIANLFKYLFSNYPLLIWAFFFGLILASIYFVGKRIEKWNTISLCTLLIGTIIAITLSLITPSSENSNLFFVFICGIIGISGMILPGLSGSFILILMGNYELLMVTAITDINMLLLTTFFIGSVVGLMGFSHILAWVLKHYKDATLAMLTGFILGSLRTIWPWKEIIKSVIINGEEKVIEYNWYFPQTINKDTLLAFLSIITGIMIVYWLEKYSKVKS